MSAWRKEHDDEPADNATHVLSVMRVQQGVEVRRETLDGRDHLVRVGVADALIGVDQVIALGELG